MLLLLFIFLVSNSCIIIEAVLVSSFLDSTKAFSACVVYAYSAFHGEYTGASVATTKLSPILSTTQPFNTAASWSVHSCTDGVTDSATATANSKLYASMLTQSFSAVPQTIDSTQLLKEQKEQKVKRSLLDGLVSGSISRAAKEIVLHPIDTVKTRIQAKKALIATESGADLTTISLSQRISKLQKHEDKNSTMEAPGNLFESSLYQNIYQGIIPSLIGESLQIR